MPSLDAPPPPPPEENKGSLGDLPPELRLQIYEDVLSCRSASILRTSRGIYADIAPRLYDTMHIHASPSFADPWLRITCQRLCLQWTLDREADCTWAGLSEMPFDKLKLVVHLYAPDQNDMGGLILLWQKVRGLAGLLQQSPASKDIEIVLRPYKKEGTGTGTSTGTERECEWRKTTPPESFVSLPADPGAFCGGEILYIPFCRLPNIRRTNIAVYQYAHARTAADDVDSTLAAHTADIDVHLDAALDTTPGATANMLRLARFANWFARPPGKPTYQAWVLRMLRHHGATVSLQDPALHKLRLRFAALDTLQLFIRAGAGAARDLDFDTSKLAPSTEWTWTWEAWARAYPAGIPVLTGAWLQGERARVDEALGLKGYLRTMPALEPVARADAFWQKTVRYSYRVLGVSGGLDLGRFVWRPAERRWCVECRALGFRDGCGLCDPEAGTGTGTDSGSGDVYSEAPLATQFFGDDKEADHLYASEEEVEWDSEWDE